MHQRVVLSPLIGLIFLIILLQLPPLGYAQIQLNNESSFTTSTSEKYLASVNARVTLDISNDTYKTKAGMLTSAVGSFVNSGPNILKIPGIINPIVKTEIVNQINNNTQSLEGTEATHAIIGVEISRAMKSIISSSDKLNQTAVLSIDISTKCAPLGSSANCSNKIVID